MPVIDPCLSGDCVTELYNILNSGLVLEWPKARIQLENALDVILSQIGNSSPFAFTVTPGTAVKDYRALLWPTGLPNQATYPYLVVVNGPDVWVAPNNPAYDIGTVPATPGTGTKWINMTTLVQPSQRQAQGRLTLTSGTPMTTADVVGATTLYYS